MGSLILTWQLHDGSRMTMVIDGVTDRAMVRNWWLYDNDGNTLVPRVQSMVAVFEPAATSEESP